MPRDLMNMLNEINPGIIERQRTIAVIQRSYSHVIRLPTGFRMKSAE